MKNKPVEASRIRPPGWRDPRLIIGVILVALSVAGVVSLVQSVDTRQGYWVASDDIVPGTKVSTQDFHIVQASLSESAEKYWGAERELPEEFFVLTTVRQGEFLVRRQVAEADPDGRQQVAVRISEDMPSSVTVGSRVDVWVGLSQSDGRGYEPPTRMISNAEIVGIQDTNSTFSASDIRTVYLMLSQQDLPQILDAQANGAKISVVPTVGGK